MGGRGANVKISGRVTKLPDLEGSEKQIAWAKDIRESYLELMRKARKFYERARDLGGIYKVPDKEYPGTALWAVKVYHPEVLTDYVEDTFEDIELLEKYEEAPWGAKARLLLANKYQRAIFDESIKRLDKAVAKKASQKQAKVWIESRLQ